MKRTYSLAAIASLVLWGSVALASVGNKVDGHLYTIPGVLHTSYLVTVFQCTNSYPTGFGSITWTVEIFDAAGQPAGSATHTMGGGATGVITTGPILSLAPNAQASVPLGTQGVARIIGDKKLLCSAYVTSPNSVPGYMNSLPVLSKNKQKGN